MPSLTRREVLGAASTSLVFLAGCAGSEQSSSSAPPSKAEAIDYEFERVRSETEPEIFQADDRVDPTRSERQQRHGYEFVARKSDFEDIEFASTESGERLYAFATATDFESESIFLYSTGVTKCHEVSLQSVTVGEEDGNPHLDFCQSVRPADVACSEEITHTVGYAVRLPIDGREISGTGTGMSHGCSQRPDPSTFETTVTVRTEGEE
jgi:hypothetical protein